MVDWIDTALWSRVRGRGAFAALVALATSTLYAEGVLKNGWIEVVLLAPVVWFWVAPRPQALLQSLLLSLMALCLTVSGLDLLLRPVMERRLSFTPLNISSHKLPRLPIVGRWDSNLAFDMESYGDLAAIAGNPALREPRRVRFETDAAGFRNGPITWPVDLIVLGDSFGAGGGTTQGRIFASLLATRYGHPTYNLSFPGGPYDEYINFAIEWPRLVVTRNATVVWTFYVGNDLDDAGGETWKLEALPWRGRLGARLVKWRTFRNRSPLNHWMEGVRFRLQGGASGIITRTLPDGRPMLFETDHELWGTRSKAEIEQHPNFKKLERTMVAMRMLVEERHINLIVFLLPTKGEVYRWVLDQRKPKPQDAQPSGFAKAVLEACERTSLRCLDTKPILVEQARRLYDSAGELLWWRDDTHLGERGHEEVAALIERAVQSAKGLGQRGPE